jgi:hypothetical protein
MGLGRPRQRLAWRQWRAQVDGRRWSPGQPVIDNQQLGIAERAREVAEPAFEHEGLSARW